LILLNGEKYFDNFSEAANFNYRNINILEMKDIKFNIPVAVFVAVMISASSVNFVLNKDSVSLGIFILLGLGFLAASAQPSDKENITLRKRLNKYAVYFFAGAFIFFAFWILSAKLKWI
jgi:hypothetical protein